MVFKRYKKNPIIVPDTGKDYEKDATYNPCAILHENKIFLIYRAEDKPKNAVSQLCLAVSKDGYNFEKYENNPIIRPTMPEEKRGCEDPRITKIRSTFYLTYTAYDGMHPERSENIYTALATSKDMYNWEKKGIIHKNIKAAAIFPDRIDGKYYMFIGGQNIKIATSKDLINWDVDEEPILDKRKGYFDNKYVETGPPPFVYNNRLVLFFNSADEQFKFHPSLALLDKNNPRKVLYRADKPLMTPTEDYEVNGKVNNVIFGSGLVEFKGTYFYYYGAADKVIAVATVSKEDMEEYLAGL